MSTFTEPLLVSPLDDGRTWVSMRPFGFDVGATGSGDRVEVAVGFMTDFASIPRPLWVLLPKWGKYGNASVIHDWLYWTQERPRPAADRIFLEGMVALQVSWLVRTVIYRAVRWFGWLAWTRNRADRRSGFDRVLKPLMLVGGMASNRRGQYGQLARYAASRLRTRS